MRAAVLAFVVALASTAAAADADEARRAATVFGQALTSGHAEAMRPILPQRGKVHLALTRLGPEEGAFGASQVEALFRDFLASGKVSSFQITRCAGDGKSTGLAHAQATIVDRDGRAASTDVHLAFEPEDGRWVLREVKETVE